MSRVIFVLCAIIVSCSARELQSLTDPAEAEVEVYKVLEVDLPKHLASTSGSRIIGGAPTTIQNYPFIVQVLHNRNLICAGSLLTKRHVLSAAHCFVDDLGVVASPRRFSVRAGTTYLNSGGSVHEVSAIVVHERYNVPVRDNDIAVLVLSTRVTLTSSVATAAIPLPGVNLPDNTTVVIIGWGRTNVNVAAASPVLNEVAVQLVNQQTCIDRYLFLQSLTGDPYPITETMLCAGRDGGGADACQGDSGGPLIYEGVVIGVVSWGFRCAEPLFPGVYARVSSYSNWINQTVSRYNDATRSSISVTTLLIPLVFVMLSV